MKGRRAGRASGAARSRWRLRTSPSSPGCIRRGRPAPVVITCAGV
jgi:hypothetical protein